MISALAMHEHSLQALKGSPGVLTVPRVHHLVVQVHRRPTMFFWPLMLWWAIGVHSVWGLILLAAPAQANVAILGGLNPWLELGVPARELGAATVFFAMLAATAVLGEHHHDRRRLATLLAPQYVMLVVAMASDVMILIAGDYRGRPIPRVTLLAALWPLFLAQLLHTVSILERLVYRWTPPSQ